MTIDFPVKPNPGDIFPDSGVTETGELQWIFVKPDPTPEAPNPIGSWNLIGPANVATTDYVEGLISDDSRNIRRNYDLHKSTNEVTVADKWTVEYDDQCNNLAVAGLNTELYTDDDGTDYPAGEMNDFREVITNGYSIPDWCECIKRKVGDGQVMNLGMSLQTNDKSPNMKHSVGFYFSPKTSTGEEIDDLTFRIGGTLEIQRDTGIEVNGFADDAYSIYEIVNVYPQYDTGGSEELLGYGLAVIHKFYFNPTYLTGDSYYEGQPHTFVHYVRAITEAGGEIKGVLNIIADDVHTFTVQQVEGGERLLDVNTTDNYVLVGDGYKNILTVPTDQTDYLNGVTTVDYVNTRLGLPSTYNNNHNGPFLQLSGGTVSGNVTFNNVTAPNASDTFTIIGNPTPTDSDANKAQRRKMFFMRTNQSTGDYIKYEGKILHDEEITTKKFVQDEYETLKDYTDTTFIKKSGDSGIGVLKVTNDIKNKADDKFNDNELVPWKKLREKTIAQVLKEPSNSANVPEGYLYEKSGVLYYKSYA